MSHLVDNSVYVAEISNSKKLVDISHHNDAADSDKSCSDKAFYSDFMIWNKGHVACLLKMDTLYSAFALTHANLTLTAKHNLFYVMEFYRAVSDMYYAAKPVQSEY